MFRIRLSLPHFFSYASSSGADILKKFWQNQRMLLESVTTQVAHKKSSHRHLQSKLRTGSISEPLAYTGNAQSSLLTLGPRTRMEDMQILVYVPEGTCPGLRGLRAREGVSGYSW